MSWQKELAIEAVATLILAFVASIWFGKSFFGFILGWIWITLGVVALGVVISIVLFIAIQWSLSHKRNRTK